MAVKTAKLGALAGFCLILSFGGCAGKNGADGQDRIQRNDRPFIKLANRKMGLVVQWQKPAPNAAYREKFSQRLHKNLRRLYRNDVELKEYVSSGERVPPRALLAFTDANVDDAVFVRLSTQPQGPTEGEAHVFAMAMAESPVRLKLPPTRGRKGQMPAAHQVADLIANKVGHAWTDPGSYPPVNMLSVANYLAAHEGCAQALVLYDRVLAPGRPLTSDGIERYNHALSQRQACARKESTRKAIIADRKASFELKFATDKLSKSMAQALQKAANRMNLQKKLQANTNKPVLLWALPGHIGLDLRFHADRYAAAAAGAKKMELSFTPFESTMSALLELKREAKALMSAKERQAFGAYLTTVRLTRPDGGRVAIDVTELDGRVLYPDSVRLLRATGGEEEVSSAVPNVAASKRWVLGPLVNSLGETTAYGRLSDFFELEN